MDWQKLINQFQPLNAEDLDLSPNPRETAQAAAVYNRALTHLKSQNGDIAVIALRKLAATYPDFAAAVLLLGISQAALKQYVPARQAIANAMRDRLDETSQIIAEKALAQLDRLLAPPAGAQPSRTVNPAGSPDTVAPAPGPVLEKTGRRGRVRMASERERQEVIRRGEFPQEEETNVRVRRQPAEYLRLTLTGLAVIVVLGVLVYFGVRLAGNINESNRRQAENAARLTWLLDRLEAMGNQDPAIAGLLEDYETAFTTPAATLPTETTTQPTAAPTTSQTPTQTSGTTTGTSVETTAAPTSDAAAQTLIQADSLYGQAATLAGSDKRAAGDLLLQARALLAGIPGNTVADTVIGDAATLSQAVETLIADIGQSAAEANRRLGMIEFDNKNYATAFTYFQAGYQLYPRAYGGGVAYYCGRCQQLLGNNEAAKPYFEYVIQEFSSREIADSARARLREMGY